MPGRRGPQPYRRRVSQSSWPGPFPFQSRNEARQLQLPPRRSYQVPPSTRKCHEPLDTKQLWIGAYRLSWPTWVRIFGAGRPEMLAGKRRILARPWHSLAVRGCPSAWAFGRARSTGCRSGRLTGLTSLPQQAARSHASDQEAGHAAWRSHEQQHSASGRRGVRRPCPSRVRSRGDETRAGPRPRLGVDGRLQRRAPRRQDRLQSTHDQAKKPHPAPPCGQSPATASSWAASAAPPSRARPR